MTVEAFSWENAHCFGDALAGQHRLRHRIFIERQNYQVPAYNGMEYDQFDTPAATYVVRRDEQGIVRAINRLIPTTTNYMIKELWPDLVEELNELPSSPNVWEGSRIGVDDRLEPKLRDRYFGELLCGVLEFGMARGIDWYIGIMPAGIVRRAMIGAGLDVDLIGSPKTVGDTWRVQAVKINVTAASLAEVRRRKGVEGPVLDLIGQPQPLPQRVAA
ncbi:acyl-homoserine-lactone synthase [Telmatospirillum sp. J64-1]|uniref:acyl-homoserine-lactone synthase n=1 Tax=Telmatospirillum sp. J64-1 TaxID=2502183 RepID=UPI00115D8F96|nr:acyl-homoserine-lactone synthase [Telmatospirillum sp. J64-1]